MDSIVWMLKTEYIFYIPLSLPKAHAQFLNLIEKNIKP